MDIKQIESGLVGMALFDAWSNAVHGTHKKHQRDPLIDAAFAAFEGFIKTAEAQHSSMIAGLSAQLGISQIGVYGSNPAGTAAVPVTVQQMAPFLALNVIA